MPCVTIQVPRSVATTVRSPSFKDRPEAPGLDLDPVTSLTRPPLPAAVLWDMDGTLVDTEPYWMAAEVELVSSFGGVWTHDDGLAMAVVVAICSDPARTDTVVGAPDHRRPAQA